MASYYDEHACEEGQEQYRRRENTSDRDRLRATENLLLRIARLLAENASRGTIPMSFEGGTLDGIMADFGDLFNRHPPASKAAIQSLPTSTFKSKDQADRGDTTCPVCLALFKDGEKVITMPCQHRFHDTCILPWLDKNNTCPLCRHELPTDDLDYEEEKRRKAEEKERQQRVEELHDSMFM